MGTMPEVTRGGEEVGFSKKSIYRSRGIRKLVIPVGITRSERVKEVRV